MKHHKYTHDQNQQNQPSRPAATAQNNNEANFAPSPDEVSRKAYFSYMNEGSLPGREVQHWLAAEAELIEERNRTRVHGFHNATN